MTCKHATYVTTCDSCRLDARLIEIAAIDDGWGGVSQFKAATTHALSSMRTVIEALLSVGMPCPRLFITPDGGIQAEFQSIDGLDEFEIGPDGRIVLTNDESLP